MSFADERLSGHLPRELIADQVRRLLHTDVLSSEDLAGLADALEDVDRRLGATQRQAWSTAVGGKSPQELVLRLRETASPEAIDAAARMLAANEGGCGCSGDEPPEPTELQRSEAAQRLAREALGPFAAGISFPVEFGRL